MSISDVVATTAAVSLACEVPLPALAEELVAEEQAEFATPEQVELEAAIRDLVSGIKGSAAAEDPGDLPQAFVSEGIAPETYNANATQSHRRPEREYPL